MPTEHAADTTAAARAIARIHELLSMDRASEALAACDQLLSCAPGAPNLRGLRARALLSLRRLPEALAEAAKAMHTNSNDLQACITFGFAAVNSGMAVEALAAFDRVTAFQPLLARAHAGRGLALAALSRGVEAVEAYALAARLDPSDSSVFKEVGHLMVRMGRTGNAHAAFTAALSLQPGDIEALEGQVMTLLALSRHEEALPGLQTLLKACAPIDYLPGQRLHAQLHCCDWSEFETTTEFLSAGVRRRERVDLPLGFLVHNGSLADQRRCAQIFVDDRGRVEAAVTSRRPVASPSHASRQRLRIAYLSADFRDHPVAQLSAGFLEAHDRTRFEVYGFSTGVDDDSPARQRIVAGLEHFIDVAPLQDRALADAIAERSIDIVVDLGGHTSGSRTRALAFRPAKVQISFLGFPGTTGASYIDYIVADREVIPEAHAHHYVEKVIYLPECYLPNDRLKPLDEAPQRREAGLPEQGFVYCSFNASYKILPPIFAAWVRILKAVPGSVLWLRGGSAVALRNLARAAEREGVDPSRLIGAPRAPTLAQHHARLALAGLFLDTHPYGAHTTAADALRCGVPVLTLKGETFSSRVAGSLLHACRLDRLAVEALEDYEKLAIEIGSCPGLAAELKSRLTQELPTSTLFDPVRFCRYLECAYAEAADRRRLGRAPATIRVPAS